jgi:hypothetical protein
MASPATNTPVVRQVCCPLVIINLKNHGFLDLKPHRLTTSIAKSISGTHCVAATSSASVTDNVTLFFVLLRVWIGDPFRKVEVPLTLLRII